MHSMAKENFRRIGLLVDSQINAASGTIVSNIGDQTEVNVVFSSMLDGETLYKPADREDERIAMHMVFSPMGEANYD